MTDKKGSEILQKVRIQVFDNSECQKAYYPKFKIGIKNWHLCAGTSDGKGGQLIWHLEQSLTLLKWAQTERFNKFI